MAAVDRVAPVRFLTTVLEPEDWVAIFLKSYEGGGVAQRVGPVSWIQSERFQRWRIAMNSRKYNVFVSVNATLLPCCSRSRPIQCNGRLFSRRCPGRQRPTDDAGAHSASAPDPPCGRRRPVRRQRTAVAGTSFTAGGDALARRPCRSPARRGRLTSSGGQPRISRPQPRYSRLRAERLTA